jgi:PhzF family phenazine biosynthesis protein
MGRIPYFHVDAFTGEPFKGNPAGVCLLDHTLDDRVLQSIAAENNLSETAFLIRLGERFGLRWFTPTTEVDLCGHATLASGHVIFEHLEPTRHRIEFDSQSGPLAVERKDDLLYLDFPSRKPVACEAPRNLAAILGAAPTEVLRSRDLMAVFEDEETVRRMDPDMDAVARLDAFGVIVTAAGRDADFVSRFFAPREGIPEDPVTGSAHCSLIPYWSERLGRKDLRAHQLSRRGGELFCADRGSRVSIGGRAVTYLKGTIEL